MDAHLPAHHLPGDIERTSLSILNAELEAQGVRLSGPCAPVIRRVIHATADFDFARALHFTPGAVEAGISALRAGAPLVLDTNMALAGVSQPSLARLGSAAHCLMAEEAVAQQPNWGPPPCLPHTLADPEEAPSSRASLSFTGAGSVTIENSSSSAEADISTISSPSSPVRRMS